MDVGLTDGDVVPFQEGRDPEKLALTSCFTI